MMKGAPTVTTTAGTPPSDPDEITQHLSSLKKSLEVAGATQHMQALKAVLNPMSYASSEPPQQMTVPSQQKIDAPVQNFVAQAAPVQQPVPAAVATGAQSVDPVTQHVMAIKSSAPMSPSRPIAQASVAPAPEIQAAPVAAKKVTPD